ncbi:hypothetical protein M422DRAFT_268304 [Sphaerobolus stellatus SS14]|uniref:Cytochrome P450 n=1 Tax=Sphaerobolus stellatus (strain SS14) TaxID=990650 RepID=A0A0C9UYE8_SPHS4|nr:hypothetical protein M422DRAFT_268304 [Sphaerobolus stellatus SS14]
MQNISQTIIGLIITASAIILHRFLRRTNIFHGLRELPGPPASSWLVGHIPQLIRLGQIGDADFAWTKKFGTAIRIKGIFGRDILFLSDPKAIQHILNLPYNYPKSPELQTFAIMVTGRGIFTADGERHALHRKVLDPAFSQTSLRSFVPAFREHSRMAMGKWRDILLQNDGVPVTIDIRSWLARLTLDSIGAAFDYDFEALSSDNENELTNVYRAVYVDTSFKPSDAVLVMQELVVHVPEFWIPALLRLPGKIMKTLKHHETAVDNVARQLITRQMQSIAGGKEGGKDIMSILVDENNALDPATQLSPYELISQMRSIVLAGHETTGATMSWLLYELALHPQIQTELRKEIVAIRRQRAPKELTLTDLESLTLLQAVIKETLRYHPTLALISRVARCDDVLALSFPPSALDNGKPIREIPISKGQRIFISVAAYNRLPSVWGEDAQEWNPYRFLQSKALRETTGIGVLSNLLTFSSGGRNCIGWRFAILEMQVMLCEIIEHFQFAPPPSNLKIKRVSANVMIPMVEEGDKEWSGLPLIVSALT